MLSFWDVNVLINPYKLNVTRILYNSTEKESARLQSIKIKRCEKTLEKGVSSDLITAFSLLEDTPATNVY